MGRLIRGRAVVAGSAHGPLLVTDEALSFWGGYDAATGEIIDRRHPLSGAQAAGTVFALPASRGSSTTTAVLLEAVRGGHAPAAFVTIGVDRFLTIASIVADEMYGRAIPVVAVRAEEFAVLRSGGRAQISADGTILLDADAPAPGA